MDRVVGFDSNWNIGNENETIGNEADLWPSVEPILDDALMHLTIKDRNAILLRYVEAMSPNEVAVLLGISVAAAQKRLLCGLEQLRRTLELSGTKLTTSDLEILLTGKMVQAAPKELADSLLRAVSLAGFSSAPLNPVIAKTRLRKCAFGAIVRHCNSVSFGRSIFLKKKGECRCVS